MQLQYALRRNPLYLTQTGDFNVTKTPLIYLVNSGGENLRVVDIFGDKFDPSDVDRFVHKLIRTIDLS